MAIFDRISDIFKANVNDTLDKMEDPEKMVKQIIIDMEKQVREVTTALGSAKGSEKQALRQFENAKEAVTEWEEKARMAVKAGNTELAKKALTNKVKAESDLAQYEQTYLSISTQVAQLNDQVSMLRAKLEEARSKQAMLIARSKMADAQKDIAASVSGTDTTSAFSKLEKMEQKVMDKEAQAEAFTEMSGDTTFVKDEFAELSTQSTVDEELAKLMAEMGEKE